MKKNQSKIIKYLQNRIGSTGLKWWLKLIINFAIRITIKHIVKTMYAKANNEDVNILLYKLGEGEIKNALGVAPVVMNATYDIKYLSEETEGYCFKAASGIAIDLTNRKQKPE